MITVEPIKVLLVEDNPGDVVLIRTYLEVGGPRRFLLTHVERLDDGLQHLANHHVDAILLDLSLPDSQGWESFARLHSQALAIPIVILTGLQDEELALRAVSSGAQDYLVKGELNGTLLGRTLHYAIERSQLLGEQQKLNRALNVLSAVNQTVVRAVSEQQLLGDICNILIDQGGYRLVSVVSGETRPEREGHFMAWAGDLPADLTLITGCPAGGSNGAPACPAERGGDLRLIQDVRGHPAGPAWREAALRHGLLAFLTLPLAGNGRLLGNLNIYAAEPGAFDTQEIQLLTELAGDLAYGLESLHTNQALRHSEEKLRQYNEHLTGLREIERAILAAQSTASIAEVTLQRLQCLIPHERASVTLFDPAGEEGTLLAVTGASGAQLHVGDRFALHMYGTIEQLAQGHYQLIQDITTQPEPSGLSKKLLGVGMRCVVSVPLLTRDRLLGTLNLASSTPGAFTRLHAEMAQDVAGSLAVALQNAQLFQQTQEQARQMQQIMETVPEGMIMLDAAHHILLQNPTATAYLADLCPNQEGNRLEHLGTEPLARFLEPPEDGLLWHELAVKEGKRLFQVAARQIQDQRQTRGWVLVLRDVTEERGHQQYLQAQDRLATVGQLAAGIAHDFNNIMAIIILYSETLERKPNYERRLHYLRTIREQAQHAARLIEQILDFSRSSVVEQSRLDLAPFVKEVTKLLRRTLPETMVIQFTAGEGQHVVNVDPTRLQQVLINLAVNARDAMPDGGQLEVSLAPLSFSPPQRPPLPGMAAGNWVCLSVADTGSGIQPDALTHVFEPFFTTKKAGQGVGLGLAQVYGIVKQHEGEIKVTSRVGEGTRFDIYLPTSEPMVPQIEDQSHTLSAGEGQLILLVEDNEAARGAIADVLDMLDYQVLEAENGHEALHLFNEKGADIALVISDMVMPGMGGSELYTRLKQIQPDVKVVVMTGYPRNEEKELLERGVVAWMQKPFQAQTLTETIQNALGRAPHTFSS